MELDGEMDSMEKLKTYYGKVFLALRTQSNEKDQ